MKKLNTVILIALLYYSCQENNPSDSAGVIYTNGKIYTVNAEQPWAEAVAIKDGKFQLVGSNVDVKKTAGENTEVIDLEGMFVMPGIFDLHTHPFITPWWGSMNLSLQHPGDINAILSEVETYAKEHPEKEWIIGGQWLLGVFENNSPRKEMLDNIVSDRPVALLDQTGHSMWLNSNALALAGIDADTPTSQLIVIHKDPETGEPTGTINEQAIQLVERVITQAKPEEYSEVISDIFEMFLSYGITSQETAEGHKVPLNALKILESEDRLEQRVFVSWDWKTTLNLAYTLEDIEDQIKNRSIYQSEFVYPNYVKIFADGFTGSRTSLLLEPYEDDPDFYGDANLTLEEFADAFIMFDEWGVGVHVHAIGDGTIRRVVDALQIMKEKNGDSGVRHKVAHSMMITREDLKKIADMNDVNIDFSPPIWYPHAEATPIFEPPVGKDRYQKIYPVKSAIELGLHVGQGSDWLTANPTPNPFIAMEGLITRANPFDPEMKGTVDPDEAISLEQAIAMCTLEGAWVLGVEDKLGSIEVGKYADMIALNGNLFEMDVKDIDNTKVLHAVVNGKIVYNRKVQGNEDAEDLHKMLQREIH